MIWNIICEEKHIAAELWQSNLDFGVDFAKLAPKSAFRIAPLNRSTRPLEITKIPPEYQHLIDEWALQDVLFSYFEELNQAAALFGWHLGFKIRGLCGDELVYVLKAHREGLREIIEMPWHRELLRKVCAFARVNFRKQPSSVGGIITGREVL